MPNDSCLTASNISSDDTLWAASQLSCHVQSQWDILLLPSGELKGVKTWEKNNMEFKLTHILIFRFCRMLKSMFERKCDSQ